MEADPELVTVSFIRDFDFILAESCSIQRLLTRCKAKVQCKLSHALVIALRLRFATSAVVLRVSQGRIANLVSVLCSHEVFGSWNASKRRQVV